jgi:hypothetical protein
MASDNSGDLPRSLLDPPLRLPERPSPARPAGGADDLDPEIPPLPASFMAARLQHDDKPGGRSVLARGRKALPGALAILVVGGFAAAVWWTYQSVQPTENEADVPLIVAETEPEKVVPDEEGGLNVPFQDQTIFDQFSPDSAEQDGEQLLPPPETPALPPPEEPEVAVMAPSATPEASALTPPAPSAPTVEAPEVPSVAVPEGVVPEAVAPVEEAPLTALDALPQPAEAEQPAVAWVGPFQVPPLKPAVPAAVVSNEVEAAAIDAAPTAPEAAPAQPAVAAPAPDPMSGIRIQLASLRDEANARSEWQRLQRKFADVLGKLQPVFLRATFEDGSIYYRLQAGPLANRTAAVALCVSLQQRQQDCIVARE